MTRQQILDLCFLDARHKLVELAAFLDRVERAEGQDDFRLKSFRAALARLNGKKKHKAKAVLLTFSDLTSKPIPAATTKAACGAYPDFKQPQMKHSFKIPIRGSPGSTRGKT